MNDRSTPPVVGVVVIGRNEGERLKRCLRSLVDQADHIVYVDSGSTDGSGHFARSMGVGVIELDMTKPFTMARGRNTGASHLIRAVSELEFIQFVDGDCEVDKDWMTKAVNVLLDRAEVVVVCGRRRERHPEASIYNRLIDMEWNTPIGEARACGGDSMMRAAEFQRVGGFNEMMIAGEEPELCVRLRQASGVILRIDAEMTLHDAAMTRFSQWWKRAVRGGHAYAEGAAMHGALPERHKVRQVRSVLVYGAMIPTIALLSGVMALLGVPWCVPILCIALVAYPLLWWRIFAHLRSNPSPLTDRVLYATFCALGKFAEFQGLLTYYLNLARGQRTALLEYKQPNTHKYHA